MILSPLWAHFKWLFLQKCTDLHVLYFLWQLTPHIDSTFFTWPTMSYRTVKGKMPLFTAQPSPKSCVTLSRWSSESFPFKPSNVQWKCWSRSMFHNCLYMYITRKKICLLRYYFLLPPQSRRWPEGDQISGEDSVHLGGQGCLFRDAHLRAQEQFSQRRVTGWNTCRTKKWALGSLLVHFLPNARHLNISFLYTVIFSLLFNRLVDYLMWFFS